MQEDLMPQFETFLGQHGDGIGQVRGVHRLSCLTEELFEGIGLGFIRLDAVPGSSIDSVGEANDKEIVHRSYPPYELIALSALARFVRVQLTPGTIVAPLAMLEVAR